jgi:hypothetical protein
LKNAHPCSGLISACYISRRAHSRAPLPVAVQPEICVSSYLDRNLLSPPPVVTSGQFAITPWRVVNTLATVPITLRRVVNTLARVPITLRRVVNTLARVPITLRRVVNTLARVSITLRRVVNTLARVPITLRRVLKTRTGKLVTEAEGLGAISFATAEGRSQLVA